MEFRIEKKPNENIFKYPTEDIAIANRFAQELKNELGDFLMGVIMFGSAARRESSPKSDIDILIVGDDASYVMSEPLVEVYKLIVDNLIAKISLKLHVTSMTYSSFWDHVKAGDPVVVNILRDGVSIFDTGFFSPLHWLLRMGRIRPSEESVWRYFGRSPMTLLNSRWHILQGTLDLYWAVIDSAHAALMRKNEVPPTPEHVADLLERVYVKQKLLEPKYIEIMRKFYNLSKMITHREIKDIHGEEYERYYSEAEDFVRRMRKLIEKGRF